MVSIKRAVLVVLALVLVLAGLAYVNRVALVLALAKYRNDAVPVALFREVSWSMGPDAPRSPGRSVPPTVLIVADTWATTTSPPSAAVWRMGGCQPHIDELPPRVRCSTSPILGRAPARLPGRC